MMVHLKKKGWKKVETSQPGKKTVKEKDIQALFNFIDKDKSGQISLEVIFKTNIRALESTFLL